MNLTNENGKYMQKYCSTEAVGYSEYLSKLDYSNECMFFINGVVKKQNVMIWCVEREDERNQVVMKILDVMTRWAVSKYRVIGHHFFDNGNATGKSSRYMLIHYGFSRFRFL